MKIAQSSPAFCHESPKRVLDRLARDGFEVWEIFGEGLHDLRRHEAELKEALASHSVRAQLHAPISDVNIGSLVPDAWDLALRMHEATFQAAARLGIERVTIHPGNHTPLSRGHYGKLHELTRKALKRLDLVALDVGLTLCLENMPTGWAFETDSVDKLFDLTQGTELTHCLDVAHAYVSKRLPEFLERADRYGNVHLSDNRGLNDDHLGLDEGNVPWREAVKRLAEAGNPSTLVIESRDYESGRTSRDLVRSVLVRAE